jgi:type III secretion protein V
VSGQRLGASPRADLFLAFIVSVVALFILPLPQAALDGMISLNLAASVVLLTVSTYVPSAVSFSAFPALLLFTTLFRLALNIASCKLILLHANAGHVIDAFGRLVVGNNVVVGGVVFLVIAVVQFIVIAKGSERVARSRRALLARRDAGQADEHRRRPARRHHQRRRSARTPRSSSRNRRCTARWTAR